MNIHSDIARVPAADFPVRGFAVTPITSPTTNSASTAAYQLLTIGRTIDLSSKRQNITTNVGILHDRVSE